MNKTELISEIINRLDKAEEYDKLMLTRVQAVPEKKQPENTSHETIVDKIVKKIGKKTIVEETVPTYWAPVNVSENEDTGAIDVQSFNSWVKQHVKNVPDYISKQDFLTYFDIELREIYEEKKDEAIKNFEEDDSRE